MCIRDRLRAVGMPVGGVVVNQVRATILAPKALKTAARSAISRKDVAAALTRVKVRATDAIVDGLLAEARDHAERVALEHDAAMVIADLRRPTYRLPSLSEGCLLYTSDAADDLLCVDLGGRRIIKKK